MKTLLILIICAPAFLIAHNTIISFEHYCYVQSPTDETIFNLTTLNHELNDSRIRISQSEQIRVHFCRPLKKPCNGKQDYAVCLHVNDTKEIGIGKEPPQVTVKGEKIKFQYTGDKCNETHNYTVDFDMICNFAMGSMVAIDLDALYARNPCGFHMTIETSAACAKRKQILCEFEDATGYYNLNSLTNVQNNYKIFLPNSSVFFLLNVCHSLLYGEHFNDCNHHTMMCMVKPDAEEKDIYTSIGNINDNVHFSTVNGNLHLDLTSDTPCVAEDGTKLGTTRTTIEFICKEQDHRRAPMYKEGMGTCHYKFSWYTIAACNEEVLIKQSQFRHGPCAVTDPLYSRLYDLSMLEGKVLHAKSLNENAEYEFSICSPLRKSNCTKPGTAVCKFLKDTKVGISEGLGNTDLHWKRGSIYLNYTDGEACGNNRRKSTTIIFTCGSSNSLLIDDNDPCLTTISWTTVMVCNRRCATADYKVNLDDLTQRSNNWIVKGENNSTEYHLNVCERIVNDHYTNCTDNTGICKVVTDEKGNRIHEVSLGMPENGVRRGIDDRIYLTYRNGSVCEEDSSRRISADVIFTCNMEAHAIGQTFFDSTENFMMSDAFFRFMDYYQGEPVYKSYNDCKYNFEWKSGLGCNVQDIDASKECFLGKDIQVYNLASVNRSPYFIVNKTDYTGYYNISTCGKPNGCRGKFVCNDKKLFNQYVNTTESPVHSLVIFKFNNQTKCTNKIFYDKVINLWCDVWSKFAESFLIYGGKCREAFEWTSNKKVYCPPKENVHETVTEEDEEKKSFTAFAVAQGILIILLLIGVFFLARYMVRGCKDSACERFIRSCIERYRAWRRVPPAAEEIVLG